MSLKNCTNLIRKLFQLNASCLSNMSYQNWVNYLKSAKKESVLNGCTRRYFYRFPDGRVMIEEYSMQTGIVERRAWRALRQRSRGIEWMVELGEKHRSKGAIAESGGGDADRSHLYDREFMYPVLTKSMTPHHIIWQIRNLPYPREVYEVTAEPQRHAIVIRTTNRKFFQLLIIPELDRCGALGPFPAFLEAMHSNNTLTIKYKKPFILLEMENDVLRLLQHIEIKKHFTDELSEGY